MSKSKNILSFLVGLMCGLACLVSGLSVGGARPLTAHAATDANGVAAASLAGYNATTKKYNYVYFGEYPQTRVLEVLPDWYNFPVFSERSMKVENEIKGYIAELNKTYYSTYLADAGNKYHAYYDPNYNWETTNVLRYIPMEDYANDKIAFDYKTAYYTLLVDVYSDNSKTFGYPAGTKFYPYNYAFDSYIKRGATYTVDPLNPTYTYVNGPRWDMPLDLSSGGYIRLNDLRPYRTNMDEIIISYGAYEYGDTQLLVVEPIKWRVVANESGKLTLMSEKVIDALCFNNNSNYGDSFLYSTLMVWANGYDNQKINYNPTNYQTTYFSSSNWGFIDRAFSSKQSYVIADTEFVEDRRYAYFDDAWHIYTSDGLQSLKDKGFITNGVVEANRPKANVKIFIPTKCLIANDSIYGMNTNASRAALNSDYAVVSGNLDYYSRNTETILTEYKIGYGLYVSSAIESDYRGCPNIVGINGSFEGGTGGSVSLGLRPCFCINESDLLSSGGVIASDIIDLSVNENGTLAHPVNLERTSTNAEMTYYAFTEAPAVSHSANYLMKPTANGAHYEAVETLATPLDNPAEHNGTWEFVTTHANGANFEHVIKVVYNGQAVGEKLVARVKNSAGKIIAMNVVGMVGASGNGETYFKFLHNSGELNYTVDVFTLAGTTLTQTNILFAKNGEAEKLSTIYLDPQGLYGGSDVNLGTTADTPLKTLDYAKERIGQDGTIYVMSTIDITTNYTLDFGTLNVTMKRATILDTGGMFYLSGSNTDKIIVTFKNVILDGNNKGGNCVKSNYTNQYYENGVEAKNWRGYVIYGQYSTIVINGGYYHGNGKIMYQIYYSESFINNGLFQSNSVVAQVGNGGAATIGCNLTINWGIFGGESGKGNNNIIDSYIGATINGGIFTYGSRIFSSSMPNKVSIKNTYVGQMNSGSPIIGSYEARGIILEIENCTFEDINCTSGGAVIYGTGHSSSNSNISISNCTFINNTSKVGGAIYINCQSGGSCPVTITNCTFRNNKATGSYTYTDGKARDSGTNSTVSGGGAIYCTQPLTVTNCTFDGNEASGYGGGAINVPLATNKYSITDCKFIGNKAAYGGGIYAHADSTKSSVINCIFENNVVTSDGGGVYRVRNISYSSFLHNKAARGSAGVLANSQLNYCNVKQNYSTGRSGAVDGFNIVLNACVIEENYALEYAAIRATNSLYLYNSKIINNSAAVLCGGVYYDGNVNHRFFMLGENIIEGNRIGAETHVVDGLTLPVIQDGSLVGGTEANVYFSDLETHFVVCNSSIFSSNTRVGITTAVTGQLNGDIPLVITYAPSYYMGSECLDCFFCDDPDYELEYRDVLKADGTHDYYGLFMKKKDATKGVVSGSDLIDFAAGEFIDTGILLDWDNGWELGFNFIMHAEETINYLSTYNGGHQNALALESRTYQTRMMLYSCDGCFGLIKLDASDFGKLFYTEVSFDSSNKLMKGKLSGNGHTYTVEWANDLSQTNDNRSIVFGSTNIRRTAGSIPVQCALTYVKNGNTYVDLGNEAVPSYTASDFRGIYDGEDHGIDVATHTSGATVTYSTDGVTYSASKPKYNKAGIYTTYFKVSASGKRTVMGTRQVVIQQPKTVLVGTVDLVTAFGTKFAVGDDVTNLIKATIHDEHGNAVDGKFTVRTAINSVAFTTTSINLTFTPTNPIYQTCNLSATVKIEYENLYYYSGNFYTDADHTQGAIPIATKNISTILEYMKNGGTIYFLSTYETSSALTLSTSKQVNLKRGANFRDAILQVKSSTLQIGTTTMAGQITLDGASIDGQMALIVNKGTLKMYGNVVVQNAYNTQGNASNPGGALYNTGTATIDIVKITKIRCANGGTIHNTGTLTLSNTHITDCYSSIGGAGVYTSNKATISNVSFKNIYGWTYASNVPKGFALHIAEGTATVRNCSVQNVNCVNSSLSALSDSSYTSTMLGGGAYVAPTATLNISSTTFYTCKAYNGAGIYVEGTMVASHVTVQKSTATNFGAGLGTSNTAKVTLLEMHVISSTAKTSANETAGIYVADNAQVITMAGADVEQPTTDVGLYLALAVCALVAIASVVIVCAGKKRNK